ncbi:tyrosine-type recombinase/integrase [Pyruvatibacter sp.]
MATQTKTLSDARISKLQVGTYRDAATDRLYLKVGKRTRTFYYVFTRDRQAVWQKIGRVDQGWTVKLAREHVSGLDDQRAVGVDPSMAAVDDQISATATFRSAWSGYYEAHAGMWSRPEKEAQMIQRFAMDALGARGIATINRNDARRVLRAAKQLANKTENERAKNAATRRAKLLGKPVVFKANPGAGDGAVKLLHARLRHFLNWCIRRDLYDGANPFQMLDLQFRVAARERVLTTHEAALLFLATDQVKSPTLRNLVRYMMFCGTRQVKEAAQIRFGQIDWERGAILLQKAEAKNKQAQFIPVPDYVLAMLYSLYEQARDAGVDDIESAYVFSTDGRKPYNGFKTGKHHLDKLLGPDFEPWQFRDLRRTVSTRVAELGAPSEVNRLGIRRHLPSGNSDLSRVYDRYEYTSEAREWLGHWVASVMAEAARIQIKRAKAADRERFQKQLAQVKADQEQWIKDNPARARLFRMKGNMRPIGDGAAALENENPDARQNIISASAKKRLSKMLSDTGGTFQWGGHGDRTGTSFKRKS